MNLVFWTNLARNAASSPLSGRHPRQKRLAAAAALRRSWAAFLRRLTNDPLDLHPPGFWPDYLRAPAITGLCTAIAFPLSP
jgi:hypothetical protein